MNRFARATIFVLCILVVALIFVYGMSEYALRHRIAIALPQITAASDPADVAEGARMARYLGCLDCHDEHGQGRVLVANFGMGRIVSPSMARVARDATDEQLARAIRNGVAIDARPLYGMPTTALNRLADEDVARLVGWIRAIKLSSQDQIAPVRPGPLARLGIAFGTFPNSVTLQGGQPRSRPADQGRYLATVVCAGCHALDRRQPAGLGDVKTPALAAAILAYDPPALRALLHRGRTISGLPVMMMSQRAHGGFDALSDAEIDLIHDYLRRAATGAPAR